MWRIEISSPTFINFDNNSTTQTDRRVVESILPYFTESYGNPSSNHYLGKQAKLVVQESRKKIANLINSKPQEIIFTSGATEAINLVIKGIAEANSSKGKHIITTKTEHSAVLDVCKFLEYRGFEIDYLPVDNFGLINLSALDNLIRRETILVAIMYVNNETGVMQSIEDIGKICRTKNVYFFTDATQAIGKISIDVDKLNIDLMAFSGHKFYGPKGIGGLYCKNNIELKALLHGGGQENNIRSGTLNVPGIVGLSKAFEIANEEMKQNENDIKRIRNEFETSLLKNSRVRLNGHSIKRLFNVSNICITEMDPLLIQKELHNVAFSQGSACNSSSIKPSHVLKAMGLSDKDALSSFRFSFGKYNTINEVKHVLSSLKKLLIAIDV